MENDSAKNQQHVNGVATALRQPVYKKDVVGYAIVTVLIGVCLYIFLFPGLYYRLGNIFFGEVPSLYNVNLAQYLFTYAAYPIVGDSAEFAHYQLSRTYFVKGELEFALNEAQIELEKYPTHTRTYYILGITQGYLNNEEQAIEAFTKFIDAYPATWAGRNDKAWIQFRIGDLQGALETIEPVAGNIDNPWVQNTYGTILLNLGRYNEAKKAFLHAQEALFAMSEEEWGGSYPGNDPRIYGTGLRAMEKSIESNIKLINGK